MKRPCLRFAGCMLAAGLFLRPMFAADPPDGAPSAADTSASPNAAVIYWQAFAAMPTLSDEHKQKFDAATKTVTTPRDGGSSADGGLVRDFAAGVAARSHGPRLRLATRL